jgi:hypothetical protein
MTARWRRAGAAAVVGISLLAACAHPVSDIVVDDDPSPHGGSSHSSAGKGGGSSSAGKGGSSTAGSGGKSSGGKPNASGSDSGGAAGSSEAEGGAGGEPGSGVGDVMGLEVQHKTGSGDASDNQIRAGLRIVSSAQVAVGLSSLELRYYFTSEVAPPLVVEIYDASLDGASGYRTVAKEAVKGEVAGTGADAYLRLELTEAAGILNPGDALTLDVSVHGQDWTGTFLELDDYSFAADHVDFTAWDQVTLYDGQGLLWGSEPP